MTNELLDILARLTLAASAGIVLVLALRSALRKRLGAGPAYAAWLAVPVMMAVVLLPPLAMPPPVAAVLVDLTGATPPSAAVPARPGGALALWTLLAWAVGAGLMAGRFVSGHLHFVRSLGRLLPVGDTCVAEHDGAGPLLLGLWRQRVVLPRDFATRFSPVEQVLIVAHERQHAARRDPAANAFLAALQCCFWFNPLVHLAAPRFRLDQELACDAAVMAAHPGSAKAYASAMLKSQLDEATLSASCHWQSHHPLKERIMNLQQFPLAASRRLAGRLAVGALVLAGAGAAMFAHADSAQGPLEGGRYDIGMTLTALGTTSHPRLTVRAGEKFHISKGNDSEQWEGEFLLTALSGRRVLMRTKMSLNGKTVGDSSMLMDEGSEASMRVSSDDGKAQFALAMTARPLPDEPAK
jgi:bla regulator protein blaR1